MTEGRHRDWLRLMLVTDAAMTARRGLAETAVAAVRGGVTLVQLRDKTADDMALIGMGTALRDALAPFGVPLVVNDRPAVAKAIGAEGVHVGQSDTGAAESRGVVGNGVLVGLSITAAEQAPRIDRTAVDYVGLGPVFATATKQDASPALGLVGLRAIGVRLPVPFVAIGGIGAHNARAVMRTGAAGIAVVSAICAADDPEATARELRVIVDEELASR